MLNRKAYLRIWLNALDGYELRLRTKVAPIINAYNREAARAYEESGSIPTHLKNRHERRLAAALSGHYNVVIPYFGTLALRQIKSRRIERKQQQSIFQRLMAEWIAREALHKARLIAKTDSDNIRKAIQDGIDEGEGAAQIARNIRKVSTLTPYRAALIARTETHAAATYGSIESVREAERELGVRMMKEWIATADDRTRDDHIAADGQVVGVNEKFTVGGSLMDRPGDDSAPAEQTINCRCAVSYSEAE